MPLTDASVKNAKPKDTDYKLADEKGLYVLVKNVGKYFRLDYRFAGKRKTLALGVSGLITSDHSGGGREWAAKSSSEDSRLITTALLSILYRRVRHRVIVGTQSLLPPFRYSST